MVLAPQAPAAGRPGKTSAPSLAEILRKAAAYCALFEKASLNYVCVEDVSVITYIPYRPIFKRWFSMDRAQRDHVLFDYQLTRVDGKTSERRNFLKGDGVRRTDPSPTTAPGRFVYQRIILGPMILGADWQSYHDYEILGREKVRGEMCAVIQAVPKPAAPRGYLFGKAWVGERDGRVLRLEWFQESIQNYEFFVVTGKAMGAKPDIRLTMEYLLEKNGIGFPSLCRMTESYITEIGGLRRLKSETTVAYKNYKFFTVETEVGPVR